jgi:L-rhamnose-H+ transport protein
MLNQASLGALFAALGGMSQGVSALLMQRAGTRWRWENGWLIFSIAGLLVCPILAVWLSVPSLVDVAQTTPVPALALIVLCGFAWGLGIILFRLGTARAGLTLGCALILGVNISFGALLPLLAVDSYDVSTSRIAFLLASVVLGLAGIILLAVAATLRDAEKTRKAGLIDPGAFKAGVLLCLASGALLAALNFSFVLGKPLREAALVFGAREDVASLAIWAPALAGAFLPNVLYALFQLNRNRTRENAGVSGAAIRGWLPALAAGILLYGAVSLYGLGASAMGPLGALTGWPILISMGIITAGVAGFVAGEWARAAVGLRVLSWAAMASLAVAAVLAALAGQPGG